MLEETIKDKFKGNQLHFDYINGIEMLTWQAELEKQQQRIGMVVGMTLKMNARNSHLPLTGHRSKKKLNHLLCTIVSVSLTRPNTVWNVRLAEDYRQNVLELLEKEKLGFSISQRFCRGRGPPPMYFFFLVIGR